MDKHTVDAGAAFAAVATILNWMPRVAALLSAIWYVIRLAEWVKTKLSKNEQ
jgi:hypothetical protein